MKKSLLSDIAIRPLLIVSFMVSGLIPIMIVSLISFSTAKTELKDQMFRQLESVRNIKKFQIENFFDNKVKEISVFSANPYVLKAYIELSKVHKITKDNDNEKYKGYMDGKYDAPKEYRQTHDKFSPYFKYLIEQYGYYDLFLIEPEFGNTVYTVRKESDFAIPIGQVDSSLRDVWIKVIKTGKIALSDTKPYSPSQNVPAQFLAAPLFKNNKIMGVIAVQISIDSIDEIMKERSGMWESGETYLVGQDKKMRSDSYRDSLSHSIKASFDGDVKMNGVDTIASTEALKGIIGKRIITNYKGKNVLSAYSPISVKGIRWAIIAEVDIEEIDILIADKLNKRIIVLFILSALILFVFSLVIGVFVTSGIKKTILQLENMIKDVLNGNFKVKGDTESVGVDFKDVVLSANQLLDASKKQWEERKKMEENLQFNEKLQAIGTLAGGIAHDFNNILTSIFAFTHIVMSELPENSTSKEHMNEILIALRRASELVDQILTFGRQGDEKKQKVGISTVISSTSKLLNATLLKNIILKEILPEEELFIEASPSQLNQILLNLCTNAAHAMEGKGGKMIVSAEKVNFKGYDNPENKLGNFCKLEVEDSGHGIEPQLMEKIFEPFFTTKPIGQGSGMGLSMVHGIVRNYGGFIKVESVLSKGSIFSIFLPITEGDFSKEMVLNQPLEIKGGSGEKILFVDDEIQICNAETKILKSAGFNVYAVTDPRDALVLLQENPNNFHVVITDLNMPHINGIELAEKLNNINPDIPIILTTGYPNYNGINNLEKIKNSEITKFLKKPYFENQLIEAVCECLKINY